MTKIFNHIIFFRKTVFVRLCFFLLFSGTLFSNAQPPQANQIKAVFLYNFTRFIDWPPAATQNGPFVIGILGNDPFGKYLDQVVEGEKAANQPIIIQRYTDVSEIKNCHILYINKSNATEIARELANRTILTVGEGDDFAQSGGIVRFYFENNKIRLRINQKNAKTANLQISSKLLRVATVIE